MKKSKCTAFIRVLFSVTIAFTSVLFFSRGVKADGNVEINATNFPDDNFRSYVSDEFDKDDNGYLDSEEIAGAKRFYISDKNIADLKGIEFFTALTYVECNGNSLTTLVLSENTALEYLECENNQLTTLDVSKNTTLEYLVCNNNQLTTLDVSKNTALKELGCSDNLLTTMDINMNSALVGLYCSNNQLTKLDVSKNTALTKLYCFYNQLTTLDVSKNTALTFINCSFNQLTTLDVSKNTALTELDCSNNQLTTLDVSKNTALNYLICNDNQLTTLDLSKNTALTFFNCSFNQLTTLDVSNNTALTKLYCFYNQLTTLDVSNNTALEYLYCFNNQLTTLDVSNNTALKELGCDYNKLTTLDVNNNIELEYLVCKYNFLSAKPQVSDNVDFYFDPQYKTAAIITQPQDYTGIVGDTATFSIEAEGEGLTYKWQTYSNGAWKNSSLPGSKTDTLSFGITASRDGYKFRCVITDAIGNKVISNTVVLHAITPVAITTQPKDYTGAVGSNATFTVKATGTGLKYQWQTYTSGKWKNSSLTGSTTATLSVPVTAARDGYKFRCVITDKYNQTVTSNTAVLHIAAPITITTQPKDYTGAVGSTAEFKVKATGTGLKYQWQSYKNGKWVNSSLPGYNTATLSVGVTTSRNGYKFRCVVTDKYNQTATSKSAVLHVATPVAITSQPKDFTGPVGSTAEFKVKATGTGLKYQWQTYKSGIWKNSSFTGSTTATLSVDVTASRDGYKFRCVITDSLGNTVTSKTATLQVDNTHTSTTNVVTVTTPSNLGLIDADEGQAIPEPVETEKIVFDTEDTIESVTTDVTEDVEAASSESEPVENTEMPDVAEDNKTRTSDDLYDSLTGAGSDIETGSAVSTTELTDNNDLSDCSTFQ